MEVRVAEGGRIVIPSDIRREAGIAVGDRVSVDLNEDHSVRISTRKQNLRRAQELFRKYVPEGTPVVDEFLADRRKEALDDD